MKLWFVTGLVIVWMSIFLNPVYATPTVSASQVSQVADELNHGDHIGLIHAKSIVLKLFKTHDDVIGLFAIRSWLPQDPKPQYVGLPILRYFEEGLQNYATLAGKKGDWQSFGTAIQLHTDILERLASLSPPNRVKDNTGVIEHTTDMTLWQVFGLTGGVNAEHFVIYDAMHARVNRPACWRILDSRLKEMDEMGHQCLLHYQAHPNISGLTDYRRKIHQDLQRIRPLLATSIKCAASGHGHITAGSH